MLPNKEWHSTTVDVRSLDRGDREWVRQAVIQDWGAEIVVVHQHIYHPAELPGFVAEIDGDAVGLLTYSVENAECEIVSINSWRKGLGVGTALIQWMKQTAAERKCRRLWLVTTNDNTSALRFYQKKGFVLSGVRINAVEGSRRLKPEIPLTGEDGIPIRDEIELEIHL